MEEIDETDLSSTHGIDETDLSSTQEITDKLCSMCLFEYATRIYDTCGHKCICGECSFIVSDKICLVCGIEANLIIKN